MPPPDSLTPYLLQFLWLDRPRAKSNLRHRLRLLTRILTLLDLSYPSTKPDFPLKNKKYSIPVRALRISLPLYNTIFLLVLLSKANPTSGMGWLTRLSLSCTHFLRTFFLFLALSYQSAFRPAGGGWIPVTSSLKITSCRMEHGFDDF